MKLNRIFVQIIFFVVLAYLSASCRSLDNGYIAHQASQTPVGFVPTHTRLAFPSETIQPTETNTPTLTPTSTAVVSPTPVYIKAGPGPIECPILLYHRIVPGQSDNPYNLSPQEFEDQMRYLSENGYIAITINQLRQAIIHGSELPEKPVVISFDDGDISVYKNAFPIMQKYNFVGVAYLVSTYLETPGYMSYRQVKDLIKGGWEIGSHTARHQDLSTSSSLDTEIIGSKADLEKYLGIEINSFAYPFGKYNQNSMEKVSEWYSNAVGLGASITQKESNLYYLWRRPIDNGTTMEQFIGFLQ